MPQTTEDGVPLMPYEQADAIPDESYEVSEDEVPTMSWEEPGNEPYQSDTEATKEIEHVMGAELDEQEVNHEGRTPPGEFEDVKKAVEEGNKPPNERDLGSNEEDEADPEAEEAEPVPGEPRYPVKIDGETHEIPLSELQAGYSRTSDYTKKTEQRREVAEQRGTADDLVATYDVALKALGQLVSDEQRNAINQEIRRIRTEYGARVGQHLEAERQRMVSMDRKFADPAHIGELANFGRSLGFSDSELSGVHDARLVQVLDLAHQAAKIKSSGKDIRAKAKSAPRLKPGASAARLSSQNSVRGAIRRAANRLKQASGETPAEELRTDATGIIEEFVSLYEAADLTATFLGRLIANHPGMAEECLEEDIDAVMRDSSKAERAAVRRKIEEGLTYYRKLEEEWLRKPYQVDLSALPRIVAESEVWINPNPGSTTHPLVIAVYVPEYHTKDLLRLFPEASP